MVLWTGEVESDGKPRGPVSDLRRRLGLFFACSVAVLGLGVIGVQVQVFNTVRPAAPGGGGSWTKYARGWVFAGGSRWSGGHGRTGAPSVRWASVGRERRPGADWGRSASPVPWAYAHQRGAVAGVSSRLLSLDRGAASGALPVLRFGGSLKKRGWLAGLLLD